MQKGLYKKVQSKRAARLATCERKTRVVNAKLAVLKKKIKDALGDADAAMPASDTAGPAEPAAPAVVPTAAPTAGNKWFLRAGLADKALTDHSQQSAEESTQDN